MEHQRSGNKLAGETGDNIIPCKGNTDGENSMDLQTGAHLIHIKC